MKYNSSYGKYPHPILPMTRLIQYMFQFLSSNITTSVWKNYKNILKIISNVYSVMPSFDTDTKWYDSDLIKWNEKIFNYDYETCKKLNGLALIFYKNYQTNQYYFEWTKDSLFVVLPHHKTYSPKNNCLIVDHNLGMFYSENYNVSDFFKNSDINSNSSTNSNNNNNNSRSENNSFSEERITQNVLDSVEKLLEEINDKNEVTFNQMLVTIEKLSIKNDYMNQRIQFLSSLNTVELKQQDDSKETNKKIQECIICFDSTADIVYFPCQHLCICYKCNQNIKHTKCSMCRSTITYVHHLKDSSLSSQKCFVCHQKSPDHIFDKCKHVCLCHDCKKENVHCPICFQKNNSLTKIWSS